MAHFAELESKIDPTGFTSDTLKVVVSVTVVGNDCVPSDMHVDGETWCKNFFKKPNTEFKQTSYNNNFRKQYAGIGYTYDSARDKFLIPQPHASWSLDASDDWQAPITYPTIIYFEHETDTYTQEHVDGNVYPEGHEQAGQRIDDYAVGDPLRIFYAISWNETKYNADNTKGWEALKSNDTSETPTKYNWNGTAWVSE